VKPKPSPHQTTDEQIACRRFRGHLTRHLAKMESIETILAAVDQILGMVQ
jgi:hypothetical protein